MATLQEVLLREQLDLCRVRQSTSDLDRNSIYTSSESSDDEVFQESFTASINSHNQMRSKLGSLSSVSDWILLGKYRKAPRTPHPNQRDHPYKKPHSLDGRSKHWHTDLHTSEQLYKSLCPGGQSYIQDNVHKRLEFGHKKTCYNATLRSRSESDFGVFDGIRKDNKLQLLETDLLQRLYHHRNRLPSEKDYLSSSTNDHIENPICPGANEHSSVIENPVSSDLLPDRYKDTDVCYSRHCRLCTHHKCMQNRDCTCSTFEKHFMTLAESAYKNIRRPDRSPQAFHRFRAELQQTNEALRESLSLLHHMKEYCNHQ